jgi:hypothetical protein
MPVDMTKSRFIFLLVILCFFSSSEIFAFVPDSKNLLNFMLKKKGSCGAYFSAENSDIFSFEGDNISEAKIDLYYSCSGYFRAQWETGAKMLYMESLTSAMTVLGDEAVSKNPSEYFLFKDIFWLSDGEKLMELLYKRGCDLSKVRFDKMDGRICYVIGEIDKNSKKDQAELWIDKESFLPYFYNLIFKGGESSFKFRHYFKSGGLVYPKTTEIFIKDVLTRKIDVNFLNSSFEPDSSNFFIIDKFLNLYKKSDSGFEDEFIGGSDSIEKIFE